MFLLSITYLVKLNKVETHLETTLCEVLDDGVIVKDKDDSDIKG